jgi:murein L,D-transpeptidase YafK
MINSYRFLIFAILGAGLTGASALAQSSLSDLGAGLPTSEALGEQRYPSRSERTPTLILVDKKRATLELAEYHPDGYRVIKKMSTTVGQVLGDKVEEGDLKTPEGIYFFTSLLRPPTIRQMFGVMALYMDYPNVFDQMAGRTGFDIMLHSTDEPERLKLNLDSEGCIVINDEEITAIQPHVELNLTPILVFDDLKAEYRNPQTATELQGFFDRWLNAWRGKDIATYMESYHSGFTSGGYDFDGWRTYKGGLNRSYDEILVDATNVHFFRHPKYSVITFSQDYRSTFPGGKQAFRSQGTKVLYVAEERGELKIISEQFTRKTWESLPPLKQDLAVSL